jgi:hypothetical protein
MEVNGQLHDTAALSPGKSPRYPLDRRLAGPQSRSGLNCQPLQELEPPVIQPVAQSYTTELLWFPNARKCTSTTLPI